MQKWRHTALLSVVAHGGRGATEGAHRVKCCSHIMRMATRKPFMSISL